MRETKNSHIPCMFLHFWPIKSILIEHNFQIFPKVIKLEKILIANETFFYLFIFFK